MGSAWYQMQMQIACLFGVLCLMGAVAVAELDRRCVGCLCA